MVKISDLDEYLHAESIETGDVIELIGKARYISAEESHFDKPYLEILVKLPDGQTKTWTPNKTTLKVLSASFGDDTDSWVNKKVKLSISHQNVRGKMLDIIYGEPSSIEEKQTIQGRIT